MAKKGSDMTNSPPQRRKPKAGIKELIGPPRRRGRPSISRGERCRTMLSFSLLKAELGASLTALEQAYRDDTGALNNAPVAESKTFSRYMNGHQTPRPSEDERLAWAKKRSEAFVAMHDSPIFDFLDMDEDGEGARIQFACWLWRTTTLTDFGGDFPREPLHAYACNAFRNRMTTFLQAPRSYGDSKPPEKMTHQSNLQHIGKRFYASVVESFSITQKTAPSWFIPPPYQDGKQLRILSSLTHPDALCIMLFGVKHPGPKPGIRELAIESCEVWLRRWIALHPELGKGLQIFLALLGAQVVELLPVIASLKAKEN